MDTVTQELGAPLSTLERSLLRGYRQGSFGRPTSRLVGGRVRLACAASGRISYNFLAVEPHSPIGLWTVERTQSMCHAFGALSHWPR